MNSLLAFTGQQVGRLTGLSQSTLRYWEKSGVFHASYIDAHTNRPYRRIYSFRDLVSLRTLAILRRKHKINLDELRKVGEYLSTHYDAPWAELQFGVLGHHVIFLDPVSKVHISGRPLGQAIIPFNIDIVRKEMEIGAAKLLERDSDDYGQIVRHRYVVHNAWTISGTRIPTSAIWNFHEAGYDIDAIIREYPRLTPADVKAALEHERAARNLAIA